jgi:phosphoglucosamine mutase
LKNVRFTGTVPLEENSVQRAVRDAEARLGGSGRLLIRKSGTERLIRVMAEGRDEALIEDVVNNIVDAIERAA